MSPVFERLAACSHLFYEFKSQINVIAMTTERDEFKKLFEYTPEHEIRFDDMLAELRASAEWRFVER